MNDDKDAPSVPDQPTLLASFCMIAWRGFCMGTADVVPGVSGGTVALILGIYERLVTAISHVDLKLLRYLLQGHFGRASRHVDLFFLFSLACGVFVGFGAAILVINRLLSSEATRALTLAAFFGMILASGFLVARLVQAKTGGKLALYWITGLLTAGFAYWVSTLPTSHQTPSQPYVFACGAIAICAMILPGISGAMILLLLGVYEHLTEIPKHLLKGEQIGESLLTIAVFGVGCAISLICFSKVLRWLLKYHHSWTMAALCGLLFGGLRKLWPFLNDTTPLVEKFKHKVFEVRAPELELNDIAVVAAAVIAALLILATDYFVGETVTAAEKKMVAS